MRVQKRGTRAQVPVLSKMKQVPALCWQNSPLSQGMPINPPQVFPRPTAPAVVEASISNPAAIGQKKYLVFIACPSCCIHEIHNQRFISVFPSAQRLLWD